MLAQNFLTAAELGISEAERSALIKVLGMFERGEIAPEQYWIGSVETPHCGTPGCIRGWARAIGGDHLFSGKVPTPLNKLFFLHSVLENTSIVEHPGFSGRDIELAARVTRNYLTTGTPNWKEACSP